MNYIIRKPWDISQKHLTPESVYQNRKFHRREFLRSMGVSLAGISLAGLSAGCEQATDQEIESAGKAPPLAVELASNYPAQKNEKFTYGRTETLKRAAAEYTNFYEFSEGKDSWKYVEKFQPDPWLLKIDGLCNNPSEFDMDKIYKLTTLEERCYRHRCVERWAMAVPWTGFPVHRLLKLVDPQPAAKYIALETFNNPKQAPGLAENVKLPEALQYPWPYRESLTIDEAMNDLAFIATGIYGEPLPKQHGAPIRLVVPWKYGFKSIKSIIKITLTDQAPPTFWNTVNPREYDTVANVDPEIPHERWSQKREWMLGTREFFDTVQYNGYGDYVAKLYTS